MSRRSFVVSPLTHSLKSSEHEPQASQARLRKYVFAHQARRLVPALHKSGTQVHIEDTQCLIPIDPW